MLDQMSGGRLEIGFGRGSCRPSSSITDRSRHEAQAVYAEALELILKGLTEPTLTFHGKFFQFDDVPMELAPLQKPHPPVWYGVHAPESAERAARKGLQVVEPRSACAATRASFDGFRAAWREALGRRAAAADGARPLRRGRRDRCGGARDRAPRLSELARELHASAPPARRASTRTRARRPSMGSLEVGQGIAGTPRTVAAFLREQLAETGSNYCVGQFAFGDLTLAETLRSIELFARDVMPQLVAGCRLRPFDGALFGL